MAASPHTEVAIATTASSVSVNPTPLFAFRNWRHEFNGPLVHKVKNKHATLTITILVETSADGLVADEYAPTTEIPPLKWGTLEVDGLKHRYTALSGWSSDGSSVNVDYLVDGVKYK